MLFLDVVEHEVDMDEVTFQAQCAHEHEASVEPLRRAAEDAVQEQDARDGERDVEHAFQEKWEHTMLLLFQEDASQERHQEHNPNHPDGGSIERLLLSHHLPHVDADEEDRHATPKYLQVTNGMVDRRNVLHEDAPHNHHHGQPSIYGVALDEFHIAWGEEIEHHRGWDVPEVEFIVQPETPVDGNLAKEIHPVPCASAVETRNIEKAGDDEPRRIDAQVSADEKMLDGRILHPREPQSYSAEEKEHIYSHIAHAAKTVKHVFPRQRHVKEDDEEHRRSHQLATKSADICQFYIFYLPVHFVSEE